jgi:alpha-glucosidase
VRRVRTGILVAALLAAVLAVAPTAASGAVQIGSAQIVLSAPGVRVEVQRSPFRLAFLAPGVRSPALSEVANTTLAPSPLAPTADPVAPGTEPQSSGQQYEPLSFLVGSYAVQQYPGSEWAGNLLAGERTGVQFSARSVISAAQQGAGVRLVLCTDDPGRTLLVTIAPAGAGLVRVSATPQPSAGIAMVSDAFASSSEEAFYGFGGRHDALDQRGQDLASWVQEENLDGPPGTAVPAASPASVLFPNGPSAAYYPQAQFISSAGYGFLLDQPQLAFFRLDSDRPDAWSVAADAPTLSYIVAPGAPPRAIAALTRLTGRQPPPPPWALGPQLDRLVKNFSETSADYQSQVESDLADIERYRLPLSAYRLEGWTLGAGNDGLSLPSEVSLAFQRRVIGTLHARHIHVLAYLRPWVVPGSAPDRAGLTVRDSSGGTYQIVGVGGSRYALLDFTNPAAVRFWDRVIDQTLNLGFDGFMADYGEQVMLGMRFHDGQSGASMHNLYPVLYMRATREAIAAYERAHRARQIWFFNRAGYSGTPGSAAYEGGNFPGDETTDYSQASGLASLAPDMLSRAIGGAYGYGTDIGGYFDYTTPPTTKQLFLRWAEWATLSPVFRLHGAGLTGTHTPWSYDEQTVRVYRQLSLLHERAAPLIMRLWREADRTGIPPTRPLWLQFPTDPRAAAQEQEWMLGPEVLVTPVVTEGASTLDAYFPAGCWRDPQTGLRVRGPRYRTIAAPLTRLDFFFRCGTRPFRLSARPRRRARHR